MESAIRTKLLRRCRTTEEYRLYKAALEWDLDDPIVVERRADFKSESRWHKLLEPFHHQVSNLITFCRRLPVTLLADDVGLGKTISAGLVASELIARGRVSRVLIVCPKLLGTQWQEELSSKFGLESLVVTGRDLIHAETKDVGAVITTYASARLHLESIPEGRFQLLILDEAHKLRNLYGVPNPPQVAKAFRKALEDRRFRYVLMLTATPIHNRLWDIYSLIDLLTVARGHQNPFGSEGAFARKFIADSREEARHLKPEAKDAFRSVVYGYMSRVRRDDAQLYFPDREVQLHRVDPSRAETDLIGAIAKPIQTLNRLTQISILQALVSSPEALMAQLLNMARNGTVPRDLAENVRSIVQHMPPSAKLRGLHSLITNLRAKNPEKWRVVIFTTRLETQTTIQLFLEQMGLRVGMINGSSGARNQDTLRAFRQNPPSCHAIVSTEAGAEGVNLQAANVLVNFDLPWNPMIVEQRIGRVQRLGSAHAKVAIFNIILRGTFEEYIVGRLMEKLQMASHAIGDIDALLSASGIDGDDDAGGFEEQIRQLVVASLAGKNIDAHARLAEESIERAKNELSKEQATIDELLGSSRGEEYTGPRAPHLPEVQRSLTARDFTCGALQLLGAVVEQRTGGIAFQLNSALHFAHFDRDEPTVRGSALYAPGSPPFVRLVNQIAATGIHNVKDADGDAKRTVEALAAQWTSNFGGAVSSVSIERVTRLFEGIATTRVRATVAHDSYERLVHVPCDASNATSESNLSFIAPLTDSFEDVRAVGLAIGSIRSATVNDSAISEFCRFYLERRELEIEAAGDNDRKQRKLHEDFTPRLESTLVALDGTVRRQVTARITYKLESVAYSDLLTTRPSTSEILDQPPFSECALTRRRLPETCLGLCDVSQAKALRHLLVPSDRTGRVALPQHISRCALSGRHLLSDEVERSSVTAQLVDKTLLRSSDLSGRSAEPEHFSTCTFSGLLLLKTELFKSQISGSAYRHDQSLQSSLSGRIGHTSEFIKCAVTSEPLATDEGDVCQVSAKRVKPGLLRECSVTHKRVLPTELGESELSGRVALLGELETCQATGKRVLGSELAVCAVTGKRVLPAELTRCEVTRQLVLPTETERCSVTGARALKKMLVTSSISGGRLLENAAFRSSTGLFCAPAESAQCQWSGETHHPADLQTCALTGLSVLPRHLRKKGAPALQPIVDLLEGTRRTDQAREKWREIEARASSAIRTSHCTVEAGVLSPNNTKIAVVLEVRTLLGFRVRYAGLVFDNETHAVIGRVPIGRRNEGGWTQD